MITKKLVILFVLLFYAGRIFSEGIFDNTPFLKNFLVEKQHIYYYQDSTHDKSDQQIINLNNVIFKRHYVEERTNVVSSSNTNLWLRVSIDSNYKENLVIKFLPFFKSITTYYYDSDSTLIQQNGGYNDVMNPTKYYADAIVLDYPSSNVKAFFIKYTFDKNFMLGVFELKTFKQIYNESILDTIYYSFLLASIIIIAIFAVFYAVINKELANIFYSLYALCFGVFVISSYNLWPFFTSSYKTNFNLATYYVPFSLSTLFFAIYILKTLGYKKQLHKVYTAVYIMLIIKLITVVLALVMYIPYWLEQIINKTDVVIFAMLLLYAFITTRIKNSDANWWELIGLTILFIAQFLHIFFYSHWIFTIMYFEVLWFGVGISINYKRAKQQKINALRETITIKTNYNSELETEVKERTLQLETNLLTIAHLNNVLKENNIDLEHNIATLEQDRILNKEMSLNEFKALFVTTDKCIDLLMEIKWKNGFNCNVCKSKEYLLVNNASPYIRRCKECKKAHSATSDTLFHSLKFPLEKAFYILFLTASNKKYTVQQISDLIDLRVATVWNFKKKIEEKMDVKKFHKKANLTWQDLIL